MKIKLAACGWILSCSVGVFGQAPGFTPPPPTPTTTPPITVEGPALGNPMPGVPQAPVIETKETWCRTGLGQFTRQLFLPIRVLTGGVFPSCCGTAERQELVRQFPPCPTPAEIAAAKIKAEEARAAERRLAVRYLATVDFQYYPEAEFGLVSALRADRSECVRLEAAQALATGCCRTRKVMEALQMVVTSSDRDGNPAETSDRVKFAASRALQKCQTLGLHSSLPEPPQLSASARSEGDGLQPAAYSASTGHSQETGALPVHPAGKLPATGQRNLFSLISNAVQPRTSDLKTRPAEKPVLQPVGFLPPPRPEPRKTTLNLTPIGGTPVISEEQMREPVPLPTLSGPIHP